ncbi:MAG: lysine exporter LysO family protein [Paraprevotella sp.]|nr:lysine exporter LysO family protein [Paraprevotella sp.]
MKGSLMIAGIFLLGVLCGAMDIVPSCMARDDISFYVLCSLMFCVGLGIGSDPQTLKNFRRLDPRLVLLPVATVLGTISAAALVSLVLPHRTAAECMAVGSGFGYYSLSSIFITQYKGAELGTIALLSNILREMTVLLAAPLLVRWFGNLAPISVGGATTMDTTLPVISRYSGKEFVAVSIFHGFVTDFSVPFLVTFFCSI